MQSRPIIGITARKIAFFHKDRPYPRWGVAIGYCAAVEAAGGVPIVLPLSHDDETLDGMFGILDGLLLPGGQDVDPQHYGEQPHRLLDEVDAARDQTELALAKRALGANLPLLGICRGEQLLNVAAGGSLYQDLHAQSGQETLKHFQAYCDEWPSHSVTVTEGSVLSSIIGAGDHRVNSYHHQAVKTVAPGFLVAAKAPDGIVEAIESPSHTFVVGVQWHPELLWNTTDFNFSLFQRLVKEASAFRQRRG